MAGALIEDWDDQLWRPALGYHILPPSIPLRVEPRAAMRRGRLPRVHDVHLWFSRGHGNRIQAVVTSSLGGSM